MAARRMRVDSRSFWGDDLLQAARIALFKREPETKWHAFKVSESAMIDELRAVRPLSDPTMVPWEAVQDDRRDDVRPEHWLEARQALARLELEDRRGLIDMLAKGMTLKQIGARLGVSESRASQLSRELARRAGLQASRL